MTKQEIKKHNMEVTKKAYIYIRVSSEEQVSNYSLDNQEEYCRKEADHRGYVVEKVYREEGVSAKNINRPELILLLEDSRKNKNEISAVFIYKIDRISRETFDYLAIKKRLADYGIRIISVTEPTEDSPTGEFLETLLAASAKLDNATKGLRSRDGMRKRLESGWANGKAALGYINIERNEKQIIEPDPEQFDLVKKSWDEMSTGAYSLETMATYMNKLGILVKIGNRKNPVRSQHAQRLFRDKFYCGYVVSQKFNVDRIGNHQPMISEETFYKVQAIIDKRSFTGGIKYTKLNENFPLRGHVICGICGLKMTGSFSRGRGGHYPYYYCIGKHFCKSYQKDYFENLFLEYLREIQPSKDFTPLFSEMVAEKWESRYSHLISNQKKIQDDLEALYTVRKRLVSKNLSGVYSDEIFREQMDLIEDRIIVAKSNNNEAHLQKIDIKIVTKFMNNFLWNLDKAWKEGTLNQRKLLTGSIYPENVIFENNKFRTTKLSQSFELIRQLSTTPTSSWVVEEI
ncbi:MAG: Site-specific recombinase [Candidatus Woesebacteria bacterium GW2011_GWA1_40_43]|uniref:Site-specific recombinase n=1 Tax=Candidatus Woesebacteria bacterium GW2011_GWA1_40_43 TaxID=1618553 RepID=A0A0G0SGP5_9BACT|nr:MAG: Site-specific recombinase [Candidatus Woesebacteria bacterium GW2011_GWD2_40_19]KKR57626.1 MAG: Site-specific recombinase [Candidatus Woesebacteria bacterium GW2011_GWC2_40_30]KKR64043.1 MAG: Site-specific recombinase [Candidatus Woesebacteria bacterium GW2011_GWA1_40_43]